MNPSNKSKKSVLKVIILSFMTLFVVGCSDYPTTGVITTSEIKQNPTKVSGKVYEISAKIENELKSILAITEYVENIVNSNEMTVLEESSVPPGTFEGLQYTVELNAKINAEIKNTIENWKEKLTASKISADNESNRLKSLKKEYESHLSDAIVDQHKLEKILEDNQAQTESLMRAMIDMTNDEIVSKKLPVKKKISLGYRMMFRTKSLKNLSESDFLNVDCFEKRFSGRGFGSIKKEQFIDVKNPETKECIYASRPVYNVTNPEYDEKLRNHVKEILALNTDQYREELKKIEKTLKKEHIIAENATGINYKSLKKDIKQNQQYIILMSELNNMPIDIEQISEDSSQIAQLQRDVHTKILETTGLNRSQKNSLMFHEIGEKLQNLLSERNAQKKIIQEQLSNFLDTHFQELLKKHVKAESTISDELQFEGLKGSEKYLAVVVSIQHENGWGRINAKQVIDTEDPKFNRDADLVIELNEDNSVNDALTSYRQEDLDEIFKIVIFDYLKENRS